MPEPQQQSTASRFGDDASRLAGDVRELLTAHLHLARVEAQAAIRAVLRLAVKIGIAIAAALSGLAALVVSAAYVLSRSTALGFHWWLLILGVAMFVTGAVVGLLGQKRFRGEVGELRATLEELREDAYWMSQWFGQREEDKDDQ